MSFLQELHAYWGYVRLFGLGLVREYVVRACAALFRDEVSLRHARRPAPYT